MLLVLTVKISCEDFFIEEYKTVSNDTSALFQ